MHNQMSGWVKTQKKLTRKYVIISVDAIHHDDDNQSLCEMYGGLGSTVYSLLFSKTNPIVCIPFCPENNEKTCTSYQLQNLCKQ